MESNVHIVRKWPCGGGMERIIRFHLNNGESVVSMFGTATGETGVTALNLSPNNRLKHAAACFEREVSSRPDANLIFHNGYGLDWGIQTTPSQRKIFFLHTDYPRFSNWAATMLEHADGVISVNHQLIKKLHSGNLKQDAFPKVVLPIPVEIPPGRAPEAKTHGDPLVIGYSGRVESTQKRLDRLPAFLTQLDRLGLNYRMEILGDGNFTHSLRNKLSSNQRVVWHGFQSGPAYWDVMRNWKYILFLSDYEGLPVSLLEAISLGIIPVYPDFHNRTDWLASIGQEFFYQVGDIEDAADKLGSIERSWDEAKFRDFAAKCAEAIRPHSYEGYYDAFKMALMHLRNNQRTAKPPSLDLISKQLPLWVWHRRRTCQQFGMTGFIKPR